jgi:Cytochrome C oxidase, cbb3-type, subunit III
MIKRDLSQRRKVLLSLLLSLLLPTACRQDMHDQAKYKPLAASNFFEDGRASRPLVEGTIARGQLDANRELYTGKSGTDFVKEIPLPVTTAFLKRGQDRYNIFCTPCHDQAGYGQGMVVKRGFKAPQSFHSDRLREAADGYYYDVITKGFGSMLNYSSQIRVEDRWAIVAYIRALQLSQHATIKDVPPEEIQKLESEKQTP